MRRERIADEPGYTRFAAVLGAFTGLAVVALVIVALVSLLSDDNASAPPFASPTPSASPTEAPSPTAAPTVTESPTRTVAPTITSSPQPTASPTPAPTATPDGGALAPPGPTGSVSLAFWANAIDAWWFGDVPGGAATYHEGDEPPFLVTWQAEPGRDYQLEITYECRAGGAPAIDLLTGIEYAHEAVFQAEHGPGDALPQGAVPIPLTPGLDVPGANARLLYIYGGIFSLLPDGPHPVGACSDTRTISVPVEATDSRVIVMGSAWLADSADHGGLGAADAGRAISLRVSVSGLGQASAALTADAVLP